MNAILMESAGMSWTIILVYVVFIVGLFWLMGRPHITDDMVIVEFGNNKNCRIPMDKAAIVDVEKPEEE